MAQISTHRFKTCHGYKLMVVLCIVLTLVGVLYLGYFCPEAVCALSSIKSSEKPWSFGLGNLGLGGTVNSHIPKLPVRDNMGKPLSMLSQPLNMKQNSNLLSFHEVSRDDFNFDIKGRSVMVFLHIQKTGGTTFGRHLVHDLDLEKPCLCRRKRKRCDCFRPNNGSKKKKQHWLFSRYSTGWKCGLHADWTELTSCVDEELDRVEGETVKRRYFYITLLRDPVSRFLSEYRHVLRGATWKNARHWCGGREPTESEMVPCYEGETWEGVTIEEFIGCSSNFATNRQTRMLADLTLIGCYNTSYMNEQDRNNVMLASAKRNLASMAFFGLTEHQQISQYIFEQTFNLHFKIPFEQYNSSYSSHTRFTMTEEQLQHIRKINHLDIELYTYAENLLQERFKALQETDPLFAEHFNHLGENPAHNHFSWDDIEKED